MRLVLVCLIILLSVFSASASKGILGNGFNGTVIDNDAVVYKIHSIQGSGLISPLIGKEVTIEGVVIGDFQGDNKLNGFYVQEEDIDADNLTNTSEGIFVYAPNSVDINFGDVTQLTGIVSENHSIIDKGKRKYINQNQTQIINVTEIIKKDLGKSDEIASILVSLPVENNTSLEQYEGMLAVMPQELVVTSNENLGKYGELILAANKRLPIPTHDAKPGEGARVVQANNDRNSITIDDGSAKGFPSQILFPSKFGALNTIRSGDTVKGIAGILGYDFNTYRVYLNEKNSPSNADLPTLSARNLREDVPAPVGGNIKVASFNVLNYFNGNGTDKVFPTARGASSADEFERQRSKIIEAILRINPDIIGIMEVENDGYGKYSGHYLDFQ